MKKQFWLVIWLFVIELGVVLLLVPGDWTYKEINKEAGYIERSLGQQSRNWIHDKARNWYQVSMIDSGAYEGIKRHLIPSEEERAKSRGIEKMGGKFFEWWQGRIDALSTVVYQLYARLALAILWLPYMLVLLIPAIFDGWMTWKIKRTNFAYSSPVIHRYSMRGLFSLGSLLMIAFFVPIALDPVFIPIVLMAACVLVGIAGGNLQKRI